MTCPFLVYLDWAYLVSTYLGLKVCSVYLWRKLVFPTPELPSARNLIR